MIYTGVDIIEIARIEQAVQRWSFRFVSRVFTADEQAESGGRFHSLAARWAAKEAAAKALGIGIVGIGAHRVAVPGTTARWHELEVRRLPGQRPQLVLHGTALQRANELGWRSVSLSLSHSQAFAVAFVVAQADAT